MNARASMRGNTIEFPIKPSPRSSALAVFSASEPPPSASSSSSHSRIMATTAPPLPVHIINLTLQYLLPPTAPMPLHLLSRELLQRHHFLGISPDDPAEYFCWPTSSSPPSASSSIMHDLEMRAGNEDLLHKPTHEVSYEHGDDGSRARVRLSDDLDLYVLFVYQGSDEGGDGEDGWRYNDIQRITPATPSTALPPGLGVGVLSAEVAEEDPYTRSSSPSSDAYWDNYGKPTSPSHLPLHPVTPHFLRDAPSSPVTFLSSLLFPASLHPETDNRFIHPILMRLPPLYDRL